METFRSVDVRHFNGSTEVNNVEITVKWIDGEYELCLPGNETQYQIVRLGDNEQLAKSIFELAEYLAQSGRTGKQIYQRASEQASME